MGREKWLERQLHPAPSDTLPAEVQAQIDRLSISQRSMLDLEVEAQARAKAKTAITDPAEKQVADRDYQQSLTAAARAGAARSILRDIYSPAQLREQMTWFWFNHFNVHQYKGDVRLMVADYEDHAIRDHALGRFRDLLGATAHHPAMLVYLDQNQSSAGKINENYAREIMELHTMGVGSTYTQGDIQELARILTGLTVDAKPEAPALKPSLYAQLERDGLFEFNPGRHDYGDKVLLGHVIKGSGGAEIEEALDILAREPATIRRVSEKMATFFLGAPPSPALLAQMQGAWQRTDGDIAAVLSVLFHAQEFTQPAGARNRFKDPVHYVLSAVRLAYDDRVILNTAPIQNWLNRMAEGLYNKETPDGFPMTGQSWSGPGQMAVRFEVARQIGSGSAGLFRPEGQTADQPGFPMLQNALFFDRLRSTLSPATAQALAQAVSPQDWNTLYLSSPEFMD